MRSFIKLFRRGPIASKSVKPAFTKARPTFDSLEERSLMSASPLAAAAAGVAPATQQPTIDYTTLTKSLIASGKIAIPTGPTMLYLNFDGWTNTPYSDTVKSTSVGGFTGSVSDIQAILYRTSEVFAPFNVEVKQIRGDGVFSTEKGATTVFVGTYNTGGVTPLQFSDFPSPARGTDHVPNSDPYDIAFVNPNFGSLETSTSRNVSIAGIIAHEAGHTFGLAHVRTDGIADFPFTTVTNLHYSADHPADIMSYDSNDDYFNNTTFNVTDANGGGTDTQLFPFYNNAYITTQNSFTYLQTILGARPTASHVGLADEATLVHASDGQNRGLFLVDPNQYYTPAGQAQFGSGSIATASTVSGSIGRTGDFQSYSLDLLANGWTAGDHLAITPKTGAVTMLVIDVTPATDQSSFVAASSINNSTADFIPLQGHIYQLAVGGTNGSTGSFSFTVGAVKMILTNNNFTVKDATGATVGHVVLNTVFGSQISGTFTPSDTTKPAVGVTGTIGALINGSSSISFGGMVGKTDVIENTKEAYVTKYTQDIVSFSGQITSGSTSINFSGSGSYKVTATTTTTNPATKKSTVGLPVTLANIAFTSGSATVIRNLPGGTTGTTTTTTKAASPSAASAPGSTTTTSAIDAVMVQLGSPKKRSSGDVFFDPF